MPLHLTKVAVGCASADALGARMAARVAADGHAWLETRYKPTRADELAGGSLYWIIKHRLVARQTIEGFAKAEGKRWRILLGPEIVTVRAKAKRAHQGWRYLVQSDCPPDLADVDLDIAALPPKLASQLSALLLI